MARDLARDRARDTLTESVDGDLLFQKVFDELRVFFLSIA